MAWPLSRPRRRWVRGAEAGVIYMAEIVGIGTRFGNSRRRDCVGRVDEDIAIIE